MPHAKLPRLRIALLLALTTSALCRAGELDLSLLSSALDSMPGLTRLSAVLRSPEEVASLGEFLALARVRAGLSDPEIAAAVRTPTGARAALKKALAAAQSDSGLADDAERLIGKQLRFEELIAQESARLAASPVSAPGAAEPGPFPGASGEKWSLTANIPEVGYPSSENNPQIAADFSWIRAPEGEDVLRITPAHGFAQPPIRVEVLSETPIPQRRFNWFNERFLLQDTGRRSRGAVLELIHRPSGISTRIGLPGRVLIAQVRADADTAYVVTELLSTRRQVLSEIDLSQGAVTRRWNLDLYMHGRISAVEVQGGEAYFASDVPGSARGRSSSEIWKMKLSAEEPGSQVVLRERNVAGIRAAKDGRLYVSYATDAQSPATIAVVEGGRRAREFAIPGTSLWRQGPSPYLEASGKLLLFAPEYSDKLHIVNEGIEYDFTLDFSRPNDRVYVEGVRATSDGTLEVLLEPANGGQARIVRLAIKPA